MHIQSFGHRWESIQLELELGQGQLPAGDPGLVGDEDQLVALTDQLLQPAGHFGVNDLNQIL